MIRAEQTTHAAHPEAGGGAARGGAMLQVRDLARICRISSDAVRYYTRIGLLRPRRDPGNNYRLYTEGDARRLRFISRAKSLGYTLAEIRQILHHSAGGESPCPLVREIIQRRIVENRRRIQRELALQERMERALAQWAEMPDGIPDGDSVCRLIESLDPASDSGTQVERFEGEHDD